MSMKKTFTQLRHFIKRIRRKVTNGKKKDGKHTRKKRDIELWSLREPLLCADYTDHRWQVLARKERQCSATRRANEHHLGLLLKRTALTGGRPTHGTVTHLKTNDVALRQTSLMSNEVETIQQDNERNHKAHSRNLIKHRKSARTRAKRSRRQRGGRVKYQQLEDEASMLDNDVHTSNGIRRSVRTNSPIKIGKV